MVTAIQGFFCGISERRENKCKPYGKAYIVCQPFCSLSLVFCFACKGCPVPLSLASLLCKLLTENSLLAVVGVKGLETEIHFFLKKKIQVLIGHRTTWKSIACTV